MVIAAVDIEGSAIGRHIQDIYTSERKQWDAESFNADKDSDLVEFGLNDGCNASVDVPMAIMR